MDEFEKNENQTEEVRVDLTDEIFDPDEEDLLEKIPGRGLYEWLCSAVGGILFVTLLFTFVIRVMSVDGGSMIPTLQHGDQMLVLNSALCGDFERGDIVVAQKDSFSSEPIVKRIIATEGQTVDIDFVLGRVYVDGELLQEDYINDFTYTSEGTPFPLTLGEGEVLLLGDNRNRSSDSRNLNLGAVDERHIIGEVVFLAFPGKDSLREERDFGRIGFIN